MKAHLRSEGSAGRQRRVEDGSNGASFYPLVEMVPHIAKSFGVNPVMLVLPMHQASTIARPLSPVAGVVVAISGMLGMSPLELVKRASVPSIAGLFWRGCAAWPLEAIRRFRTDFAATRPHRP